jgi:hypothetical protein
VRYARAFFELQLRFAGAVAELAGLPLARTLLEYTNLYIRFGLGRDFDPAHPGWRQYLAGLRSTSTDGDWTYHFYRTRAQAVTPPALVATVGCFSYSRLSHDRIRLHFLNAEPMSCSPLAGERRAQRLAELTALFAHARRTTSEPLRVIGASWLYNLEAYRRLFPTSYLASARSLHGRFRHMPLWGQFLDRHGEVREHLAQYLLDRLGRQASLEGLDGCFPYQVLGVEAPAADFYGFYGA